MKKLQVLAFPLVLSLALVSCKRKNSEMPFKDSADGTKSLQGKPDKTSEEPIGLPGYPLICNRLAASGEAEFTGKVGCFLGDAAGQPANLKTTPTWTVVYQGPAAVTSGLIGQAFQISITAKNMLDFLTAMDVMQINVAYEGNQGAFKGQDVLRARGSQWIVKAACGTEFTMQVQDASAPPMKVDIERFDACESLSARLMNITLPNDTYRALPDTHKNVGTSCLNGVLILTIPPNTASPTLGPIDPRACLDLSAYINSLGL